MNPLPPFHDRYNLIQEQITIGDREFSIHRIADIDALLDELIEKGDDHEDVKDERIPYWAELWPSAIALGLFLVKNISIIQGKTVLELGCGLGLSGMVAQALGGHVVLSDYLPDALELAAYNWKANFEKEPDLLQLDWREPDPAYAADVLLAADVAYEQRAFEPLLKAFPILLKPGGTLILTEPNRAIAHEFLQALEKSGFAYEKSQTLVKYRNIKTPVNMYKLSRVS